ncbi:hypothetical protein O181_114824 [Austropuccinia psidii MF-1]|uniref:Uncharacterized protein n=1 Tax=Austropuccinia psidii MF-1 TaxID=1389203 RepID=A0A9Q3K8K0_9BASI|nr:hypothetical protein [Austropuccinia psidii MF-1]
MDEASQDDLQIPKIMGDLEICHHCPFHILQNAVAPMCLTPFLCGVGKHWNKENPLVRKVAGKGLGCKLPGIIGSECFWSMPHLDCQEIDPEPQQLGTFCLVQYGEYHGVG